MLRPFLAGYAECETIPEDASAEEVAEVHAYLERLIWYAVEKGEVAYIITPSLQRFEVRESDGRRVVCSRVIAQYGQGPDPEDWRSEMGC